MAWLSRTAERAHVTFRWRLFAMFSMKLAAMFSIFFFITSSDGSLPLISTGCAAPRQELGAMAAPSASPMLPDPASVVTTAAAESLRIR